MNKAYRLVWSERHGSYVVVAEIARARGKRSGAVVMAAALSALFTQPVAADVTVASGNTSTYAGLNGVPVVDIATANAAGISHNKYNKFNVDSSGLVLNNNASTGPVQSQLAGQVERNMNLGSAAKLILNEVVFQNRSTLSGYMEVAGTRADVVVANPWGITCNGCGFINTDRATLTTGTPDFAGDGSLTGFRVNQGDIRIGGIGLDGKNQNILDIVARSIVLDGQVNAKDLQLVAGSNTYDYATRSASVIAIIGTAPAYAIDSTVLGGMYASKISIIATEQGVGVRKLGEVAASGSDFTLNAAGKIEIQSKISAAQDVTISSTASGTQSVYLNNGSLSAGRDLTLNAGNGELNFFNGSLVAGRDLNANASTLSDIATADAKRFATNGQNWSITGSAYLDGALHGAGGRQGWTVGSLSVGSNGTSIYSGSDAAAADRSLSLTATTGNLALGGASLLSPGSLSVSATVGEVSLGASGSVKSTGTMNLSAGSAIRNQGNLLGAGQIKVQATDADALLDNSGVLQASGNLVLGTSGHIVNLNNSASLLAGDTLTIEGGSLANSGTVQAANGSVINAASLNNTGSGSKWLLSTVAGKTASISLTSGLGNQGTLQSAGDLTVAAQGAVDNSGTLIVPADGGGTAYALSLSGDTLSNSGNIEGSGLTTLTGKKAGGTSISNSGQIHSGGATLTVTTGGGSIDNTAAGSLLADHALTVTTTAANATLANAGRIQSSETMTIGGTNHTLNLNNSAVITRDGSNAITGGSIILAGTTLGITGGSLSNLGIIQATTGATVTGSSFTNSGSGSAFIASTTNGADGSLTLTGNLSNAGTLQSAGGLAVNVGGNIGNSGGVIYAAGTADTLSLSASQIVNSGTIQGNGTTTLTATLNSGNSVDNSGTVYGKGALSVTAGADINNAAGGQILGDTTINLVTTAANATLANTGRIQSLGAMTVGGTSNTLNLDNSAVITRDGNNAITGGSIILAGTTLGLTGGTIANSGMIQATTGATVTGSSFTNGSAGGNSTAALILSTTNGADGSLTLTGDLNNYGKLQSAGSLTMSVGANHIYNRAGGLISATGTLSDSLGLTASTIDNWGTIQGAGTVTLTGNTTSGNGLANYSGATVYGSGGLTVTSAKDVNNAGSILGDSTVEIKTNSAVSGATSTLTNTGLIQSGGNMSLYKVGSSLMDMSLTNDSAGKIISGGRLNYYGYDLNNQGTMQAATGMNLDSYGALVNGSTSNSGALILAATGTAETGYKLIKGRSLSNYGAIHSNDDLTIQTVNTGGIVNQNTGGLSSLGALSLTTGGVASIDNYGALYSSGAMSLTATGYSIFNRQGATIDSDGKVTTNSANFYNYAVMRVKDAEINTSTYFYNGPASMPTKYLDTSNVIATSAITSYYHWTESTCMYCDELWLNQQTVTYREVASGTLPTVKPQILASGTLTVNYGAQGVNRVGTLSGSTVNLNGTSFTNEDFYLDQVTDIRRTSHSHTDCATCTAHEYYDAAFDEANWARMDPSSPSYDPLYFRGRYLTSASVTSDATAMPYSLLKESSRTLYSTVGTANVYATTLTVTGGSVTNSGSPNAVSVASQSKTANSATAASMASGASSASTTTASGATATSGAGTSTATGASGASGASTTSATVSGTSGAGTSTATGTSGAGGASATSATVSGTSGAGTSTATGTSGAGGASATSATVSGTSGAGTSTATGASGAGGADATSATVSGTSGASTSTAAGATAKSGASSASAGNVGSATAASVVAANALAAAGSVTLGSFTVTFPTNPNGYFVPTKDPQSHYLVETNPRFSVGTAVLGSDYLEKRLGFNPDTSMKRLGDANYEAYLVRQQLIKETGRSLLAGSSSEDTQIQRFMDQAATQAGTLGLVYGKALTPAQASALTNDIVWMEKINVGGVEVLAPHVYLSAATKAMITGSATMSAENTTMNVTSLTNTGGTIEGSKSLSVTSAGDITNVSGTIKGGDVSLTSTGGSIVNKTQAVGRGDSASFTTTIGKTGTIEATGNLGVSAAKDITVLGGDVKAGGNAALKAGGSVTFDTIVNKTSNTSVSSSSGLLGLSGSETTNTTTTEKNIGSGLTVGGNLGITSGKDTTIAGSKVSAGSLSVDAKGDFNVLSRQDTTTTRSVTETSGVGVGGGVYGTEKKTTDTFTGTNAGSSITVGGNANVKSDGKLTLQGSEMKVSGKADLNAKQGIDILDGKNEQRSTTVTETTTFLKVTSGSDSGAKAAAKSGQDKGKASASASASAGASNESSLRLMETSTTTEKSSNTTSVGSTLNVGGNLNASTDGTLKIQGSSVSAGGDVNLGAKKIEVLTGRNESLTTTDTTRNSVGFYSESNSEAKAGAQANANGRGLASGASAKAEAKASADTTLTIGGKTEQSHDSDYALTNTSSVIKSGGNMSIKAKDDATFVGAKVDSGGSLDVKATNITNKAAQDVSEKTSSSRSDLAGVYIGASAEANAKTSASAQSGLTPGANADASAGVKGEVTAGVRYKNEQSSSKDGSVTQVTNSFTAKGDITRTAKDTITDQGTQMNAGGNIDQKARVIKDEAVSNSTYSSKDAQSHDARIGAYVGGSAEAGASGQANTLGGTGAKSDADATGGAGVKASYKGQISSEGSSETTAVTSSYKAGGNISSTSKEKTTLTGATLEAGGNVNLNAGSLEYKAAADTKSTSGDKHDIDAQVTVRVVGKAGVDADASYKGAKEAENSSTARVGSIKSGGSVNVNTGGDASFTGTNIDSKDKTTVNAGGNVNFDAAHSTSTSSSREIDASASLSTGKGSKSVGAGVDFGQEKASSDKAQGSTLNAGGGIQINAGKSATLEGTGIKSGGDVSVTAKDQVNLKAATSRESDSSVSLSVGMESKKEKKDAKSANSMGASAGVDGSNQVDSTATSISAQGKVNVQGGTVVNQEATMKGGQGTTVEGTQVNTKMENSSSSTGISIGGGNMNKKSKEE